MLMQANAPRKEFVSFGTGEKQERHSDPVASEGRDRDGMSLSESNPKTGG
jgi:hypothetical protein